MWNSHTIVAVFKFSCICLFWEKGGYHLKKEKNLSFGCIQQTILRLCCCVHVSCPLAVGRYILSSLVKKFTWQFVLYISQISMQLSILTHQISMQLSIFKMCLTKKTPPGCLQDLKDLLLVPDAIAHPQGGYWSPPPLPCKRSANTF